MLLCHASSQFSPHCQTSTIVVLFIASRPFFVGLTCRLLGQRTAQLTSFSQLSSVAERKRQFCRCFRQHYCRCRCCCCWVWCCRRTTATNGSSERRRPVIGLARTARVAHPGILRSRPREEEQAAVHAAARIGQTGGSGGTETARCGGDQLLTDSGTSL